MPSSLRKPVTRSGTRGVGSILGHPEAASSVHIAKQKKGVAFNEDENDDSGARTAKRGTITAKKKRGSVAFQKEDVEALNNVAPVAVDVSKQRALFSQTRNALADMKESGEKRTFAKVAQLVSGKLHRLNFGKSFLESVKDAVTEHRLHEESESAEPSPMTSHAEEEEGEGGHSQRVVLLKNIRKSLFVSADSEDGDWFSNLAEVVKPLHEQIKHSSQRRRTSKWEDSFLKDLNAMGHASPKSASTDEAVVSENEDIYNTLVCGLGAVVAQVEKQKKRLANQLDELESFKDRLNGTTKKVEKVVEGGSDSDSSSFDGDSDCDPVEGCGVAISLSSKGKKLGVYTSGGGSSQNSADGSRQGPRQASASPSADPNNSKELVFGQTLSLNGWSLDKAPGGERTALPPKPAAKSGTLLVGAQRTKNIGEKVAVALGVNEPLDLALGGVSERARQTSVCASGATSTKATKRNSMDILNGELSFCAQASTKSAKGNSNPAQPSPSDERKPLRFSVADAEGARKLKEHMRRTHVTMAALKGAQENLRSILASATEGKQVRHSSDFAEVNSLREALLARFAEMDIANGMETKLNAVIMELPDTLRAAAEEAASLPLPSPEAPVEESKGERAAAEEPALDADANKLRERISLLGASALLPQMYPGGRRLSFQQAVALASPRRNSQAAAAESSSSIRRNSADAPQLDFQLIGHRGSQEVLSKTPAADAPQLALPETGQDPAASHCFPGSTGVTSHELHMGEDGGQHRGGKLHDLHPQEKKKGKPQLPSNDSHTTTLAIGSGSQSKGDRSQSKGNRSQSKGGNSSRASSRGSRRSRKGKRSTPRAESQASVCSSRGGASSCNSSEDERHRARGQSDGQVMVRNKSGVGSKGVVRSVSIALDELCGWAKKDGSALGGNGEAPVADAPSLKVPAAKNSLQQRAATPFECDSDSDGEPAPASASAERRSTPARLLTVANIGMVADRRSTPAPGHEASSDGSHEEAEDDLVTTASERMVSEVLTIAASTPERSLEQPILCSSGKEERARLMRRPMDAEESPLQQELQRLLLQSVRRHSGRPRPTRIKALQPPAVVQMPLISSARDAAPSLHTTQRADDRHTLRADLERSTRHKFRVRLVKPSRVEVIADECNFIDRVRTAPGSTCGLQTAHIVQASCAHPGPYGLKHVPKKSARWRGAMEVHLWGWQQDNDGWDCEDTSCVVPEVPEIGKHMPSPKSLDLDVDLNELDLRRSILM